MTGTPSAPLPDGRFQSALEAVVELTASPGADSASSPVAATVVIPSYQHGHLVAMAARAALVQTLEAPYEVLVVDDGSTDGTAEAVRELVATTTGRLRSVRLARNLGKSMARNAGVALARGALVAFTDADCLPTPTWLEQGLAAFTDPRVGVVQGPTRPHPGQRQPFFNHFIEIERFDGTFSTCNVFYRRDPMIAVGGFDPACVYWEDVDLGWRVRRLGWKAAFAPEALVHHQVLPLPALEWLRWPLHFATLPAKAARYPEYRRYLFLGLWVHWFHALFDLAALSLPLAAFVHRGFLALALPYLVAFPFRHGLRGRWPPAKAILHLAWDVGSFFVLLTSSLRHRAPVL